MVIKKFLDRKIFAKKGMNKKGSILAFSLIILAMMMTIALSTASVNIIQKKNASSTEFSVQAYQVADGGALWALKRINMAIYNNASISSQLSGCSNGVVAGVTDGITALGSTASFDISFYDSTNAQITNCGTAASSVERIKSVGKFRDTVRAVSISIVK